MQKNLKIATFFAVIFVIIVFSAKYFSTTTKTLVSYQGYTQELQKSLQKNALIQSADVQDDTDTKEDELTFAIIDAFDYNIPVEEVDEKALKRYANKKLNYSNYEDRIRMEEPEYMDANGLYVALMQAVADNDISRAKTLINRGAKLNSPDGNTSFAPIFWAISNGNVQMVKLLLANGAKVNTPDEKGFFPIHWIVEYASERPKVYKMKEIFDLLLNSNPREINRQDLNSKQTPIMMSINLNNKKAFGYLLDKGANVTIKNKENRNISDIALAYNCHACIKLINKKEAANATTPLPNFETNFEAPDNIWLPYSVTKKKVTKKKTTVKNPDVIVIEGNNLSVPDYKPVPDILPLDNTSSPNIVIRS